MTSALEGGGWSAPRPGRFTPRKDPVPIVQETGWAPGLVWMCAKNCTPNGIRSLDRPAHSQTLCRLSYLAHIMTIVQNGISAVSTRHQHKCCWYKSQLISTYIYNYLITPMITFWDMEFKNLEVKIADVACHITGNVCPVSPDMMCVGHSRLPI
jgi:hypothetical protein